MNSRRLFTFIAIFSLIGLITGLYISRQIKLNKPTAGLKIETQPESSVLINNKASGVTPYDHMLPPGEVVIKLTPNSPSGSAQAYETKLKLTDKVYTIVYRDFGASELTTSGATISLVPFPGKTGSLSLVSDPDSASVLIDNQPQGFTPLSLEPISPGNHQVDVSAPGFVPRNINVNIVSGFKAMLVVKLAASGPAVAFPATTSASPSSASPSASPTGSPTAGITILSTPTGFLRVRSGPSLGASEVSRVKPGEKYQVLEKQSGWVKIQLTDTTAATTSGWISTQYTR